MSGFIKLKKIEKFDNTASYYFENSPELDPYFNKNNLFTLQIADQLQKSQLKLCDVPDSVLVIPFLGNVLPISWLLDTNLSIDVIDKSFYNAIPAIKSGYANMYPNLDFRGSLSAKNVIDTPLSSAKPEEIAFFSAGVDAWQTFVTHYTEHPTLLTLFGMDFYLENPEGNKYCTALMQKIAKEFNCDAISINTSMRQFINEKELNARFSEKLGFHWFHRIQHGMGAITHAAPIAWIKNSKVVYFASSYSFKDKEKHKCATDPTIDNNIAFASAHVVHDGYECSRQDKIYNITRFTELAHKNIFIHVCWSQDKEIKNCCRCEKCMRTMFGLLAEGFNPNDFGFKYEPYDFSKRVKYLLNHNELVLTKEMWEQIIFRFKMNPGIIKNKFPELNWVLTYNFPENKNPACQINLKINSELNFSTRLINKGKRVIRSLFRI